MLPLIKDLDSLPFANKDIWNYQKLQMESIGVATVMFSRGCPRKCTYCGNHAIAKIYKEGGEKKYFRQRSTLLLKNSNGLRGHIRYLSVE
jgi:radical SAM superfamily enzyme YgiQ (UPF0313 family)